MRFFQLSARCFVVGAVILCPSADIVLAQSPRQQLIAKIKQSCDEAKEQLEQTHLPDLELKRAAFNILAANWRTKMPSSLRHNMPAQLRQGLETEKAALKRLFANASALDKVLKDCGDVTDNQKALSLLNEQATKVDSELKNLRKELDQRAKSRQDYKRSLNEAVDLLIKYNHSNLSTYIKLNTELDPSGLDLMVTEQSTLLLPIQLGLNVLK